MTAMANLGSLWNSIQTWLFPILEDELGELDEKHREFVVVCEFCSPRAYMASYRWVGNGCPPASRLALCKTFIAKAVWDFPTTRGLSIKILCKSSPKHCSTWDSSCPHSLPQHRFMRFCKRLYYLLNFFKTELLESKWGFLTTNFNSHVSESNAIFSCGQCGFI